MTDWDSRVPSGTSQHGYVLFPTSFNWPGAGAECSAHGVYSGFGFCQASTKEGERGRGIEGVFKGKDRGMDMNSG